LDICYLDVPLLAGLVKKFPEIIFHFIGSYQQQGKLYQACLNCKNIKWWGRVDNSLIPAILKKCDILLVTYLADQYREQLASTHKMMEYLASGKTVVATYTGEYKDKRHLLEMVDKNIDFPAAFANVLANLDQYNSADKQAARKEFARRHSYDRQLDRIFDLIQQHGLDTKLSAETI
jgi:glycosyltransferase involved in cell wall biosynthesis